MSSQYCEGWFPECYVCGSGNLGDDFVCSYCAYKKVEAPKETDEYSDPKEEDGHWFSPCAACKRKVARDASLWGHYAICLDCYKEVNGDTRITE